MQDELTLAVDARLAGAAFEDEFAGSEQLFLRFRHEPGRQIGGNRISEDARRGAAPGRRGFILGVLTFLLVAGARVLLFGRAHLDQVLGGEKSLPRQQALINRAQLHDAEIAVINAANRAGLLINAHRQTADDLLQHAVGQPGPVQQGRGLRIEQRGGERLDDEMPGVARRQCFPPAAQRQALLAAAEQVVLMGEQRRRVGDGHVRRRRVLAEALMDQRKQFPQMLVKISPVLAGHARLAQIGQIAQRLQAVAEPVDLLVDRQCAKIAGVSLRVQAEQQPIDKDQGFAPQNLGINLAAIIGQRRFVIAQPQVGQLAIAAILHPGVGDGGDRLPHLTLQGLGHAMSEPVALALQPFVQGFFRFGLGGQRRRAQQERNGLEGPRFAPPEGVVELEAQVAPLRPGVPVEELNLAAGQQHQPARRVLLAEDQRQRLRPQPGEGFKRLVIVRRQPLDGLIQRVFRHDVRRQAGVGQAERRLGHDQPGLAVPVKPHQDRQPQFFRRQRQGLAVERIAQCLYQLPVPAG